MAASSQQSPENTESTSQVLALGGGCEVVFLRLGAWNPTLPWSRWSGVSDTPQL